MLTLALPLKATCRLPRLAPLNFPDAERSVEVGARASETRAFNWLQASMESSVAAGLVGASCQAAPPGAIARGTVEGLFAEAL